MFSCFPLTSYIAFHTLQCQTPISYFAVSACGSVNGRFLDALRSKLTSVVYNICSKVYMGMELNDAIPYVPGLQLMQWAVRTCRACLFPLAIDILVQLTKAYIISKKALCNAVGFVPIQITSSLFVSQEQEPASLSIILRALADNQER